MSRKPKPGPTILRIETLSDGQPHALYPMVSDFPDAEPIPLADNKPIGPIPPAQLTIDARNRAKAAHGLRVLQALGLAPKPDSALQEPKPKPLAHNQIRLGAHVATFPAKPFRRI